MPKQRWGLGSTARRPLIPPSPSPPPPRLSQWQFVVCLRRVVSCCVVARHDPSLQCPGATTNTDTTTSFHHFNEGLSPTQHGSDCADNAAVWNVVRVNPLAPSRELVAHLGGSLRDYATTLDVATCASAFPTAHEGQFASRQGTNPRSGSEARAGKRLQKQRRGWLFPVRRLAVNSMLHKCDGSRRDIFVAYFHVQRRR